MLRHRQIIQPDPTLDQLRRLIRHQLITQQRHHDPRDEAHEQAVPGLHARGVVTHVEDLLDARLLAGLVLGQGGGDGGPIEVAVGRRADGSVQGVGEGRDAFDGAVAAEREVGRHLVRGVAEDGQAAVVPVVEDDFFQVHELAAAALAVHFAEEDVLGDGGVGEFGGGSVGVLLGVAGPAGAGEGLGQFLVEEEVGCAGLGDDLDRVAVTGGDVHVGAVVESWDPGRCTDETSVLYFHCWYDGCVGVRKSRKRVRW